MFFALNPSRLKRDSTKLNSADMLALLSFLEAKQRNHYDNGHDDVNSLEYQKPFYGSYGNFDGGSNDDEGAVNGGEWWNEWIEPSVQYYGNARNRFDENPRKRLTAPGNIHSNILPFIVCTQEDDVLGLWQFVFFLIQYFFFWVYRQYSQQRSDSWLRRRSVH